MQGRFLKYILLSIYLMFALAALSICVVAFIVMGKTEEDQDGNRITALNMPLDEDYHHAMRRNTISKGFVDKTKEAIAVRESSDTLMVDRQKTV